MYYFYVLYSLKDNRLYKGASNNLPQRVLQHDAGMVKSTRHRRPLILLYFEGYAEKEVLALERWVKSLEEILTSLKENSTPLDSQLAFLRVF